jgi:GNAT superfamily N-acetyltransferase
MSAISYSIGGELVTTKFASKMEETMQAFAVRAACFIGELGVPFSEEFDGHDFGGTHILAYAGTEPVGTMRVRWFQSFAMPERLAVIRRFRGHNLGRLLLERCCKLAKSRGCTTLYSRALAKHVKYLEKQGWRCLDPETPAAWRTVAIVRPVDLTKPRPELNAIDARTLSEQFKPDYPIPGLGDAALSGRHMVPIVSGA